MKKLFILLTCLAASSLNASIIDFFISNDKGKILLTEQESKKQELDTLITSQQKFEEQKDEAFSQLKQEIQSVEAKIKEAQEKAKDETNEFITKRLALLNEMYHVLKKNQALLEQLSVLRTDRIELLESYLKDPQLKRFKDELLKDQCVYAFSYIKKLHQMILDKKKALESTEEQEEIAKTELENRKRAKQVETKKYEKTKEEREALKKEPDVGVFVLTSEQCAALQILEDKLYENKNRLNKLRIQESRQIIDLNKTKKFINKIELSVLEVTLRELKPQVRVGESEIAHVKDELEEARQASYEVKRKYDQQIDKLDVQQKEDQKELQALSEQTDVKLGLELDEWSKEPQRTADAHEALCKIGLANSKLLRIKRQKDELKMSLATEDETIRAREINVMVQETFYKIQTGRFATDEVISQELKKYRQLAGSVRASLNHYRGQIAVTDEYLKAQKKALTNITERLQKLKEQEQPIFKDQSKKYRFCNQALQEAQEISKEQVNLISQIKNGYTDVIAKLESSIELIDFISSELGQITIWHRPEHAVSWDGIKNVITDLRTFVTDVRTYVSQVSGTRMLDYLKQLFFNPAILFILIIQLIILAAILYVIRIYLPRCTRFLIMFGSEHGGARLVSFLFAAVTSFVTSYFFIISVGIVLFFFIKFYLPVDPHLYMLLYLLVIPYLIYIASRAIRHLIHFNEQHDYFFLGKDFQQRFAMVISTLIYATLIIWFFREAFLLGNYRRSELPTILLAVNFIILQISLISLISKDQILNLIPKGTSFWDNIHGIVDRYYYLFFLLVIAVIVMSNPYVGFGKLVLYILRRVLYTIGLLALLIWFHQVFRRFISHLFFSTDNEITKERFPYAKTWYGAMVIILFVVFAFIGSIFIAKIWSWPEWLANISSWSDLEQIFKTPLGDYTQISVWTVMSIVLYALGGILVSYAFTRFVLDKIFDILHVEVGVQDTISSISHYIIFVTALILAFNAVGLGTLVVWLVGALAVSIGFVIKDPISDFVAYFIILVQRPVKIGDYIELDDQTGGVVRKITPRSVVLRRKNSTTIVLPNSMIISKPVVNWNYTRGFIAFNDIIVTVSYTSDPVRARELMHHALSENQSILKNPRPIVRLDDFSADGYQFTVRGYLSSSYTLDQWDIASDIRMSIYKEFEKNNIELAVPIRLIVTPDQIEKPLK